MRRMKSRARGSSSAIRKRTSHIRIILTDEIEIVKRRSGPRKKSGKPGAARSKTPQSKAPAARVEPAAETGEDVTKA